MTDLRQDILETIDPGSMTKATIVDQLTEDYSEREIKSELADMLVDDSLEEHPEIDGVYRVSE
jgi:hypothetical protein